MQINPKRLSNNCHTDTKSNERPPTLTLLRKKKETIHHFIYSVPLSLLTAKKTVAEKMNYQPDPPQLFSFDGRLALLIKMGIPQTPIYRTYVQITYVWQGEPTNLDVLRKTALIPRRSSLMPHLRRVVGGQEALNLRIEPHHYVIRHF